MHSPTITTAAPANPPRFSALAAALDSGAKVPKADSVVAKALPTAEQLWAKAFADRTGAQQRGETTHFRDLDKIFRWKRGKLVGFTGWPGHGKSEFISQIALAKSVLSAWQWAIYSPEEESSQRLVNKWVETWTGASTVPGIGNCLPMEAHKNAFFDVMGFLQPIDLDGEDTDEDYPAQTLESIIETVLLKVKALKAAGRRLDGVVIDPWNSVDHDLEGQRDDQYLRRALTRCKRFAKRHNLCFLISVHPSGTPKDAGGTLKQPDQYSMESGRMWANRLDDVLCIHRPNIATDPDDTTVEVISLKIKDQRLSGCRPGRLVFTFNRELSRYYQESDGWNPFPPVGRSSAADAGMPEKLPAATKTPSIEKVPLPDSTGFPVDD